MSKVLGLVLVALGALMVFKMMLSGWFLFLLVAAGLAFGASSGIIGKWGYAGAVIFGLLALPALMFKTVFTALAVMIKLLPFLLMAYGAYVLLKAFGK